MNSRRPIKRKLLLTTSSPLDLLDEPVPVLPGRSVLAAGHPRLDGGVRTLLAARAPKVRVRGVTARLVLGAALLGLDRLFVNPEALALARAHWEVSGKGR
ncbi:hypothetical protein [Streptomyces griseofuscus]|uniref:hypothetical protein n=1 Tax=Streptomyces griseofuscus TaxID=146922 RepID=UPI0036B37030